MPITLYSLLSIRAISTFLIISSVNVMAYLALNLALLIKLMISE